MSESVLDSFDKIIQNEESLGDIFKVRIVIPPLSGRKGGVGIDTTNLFNLLNSTDQYGHSTKITSIKGEHGYGGYYDSPHNRGLRQQDLVVTAIAKITGRIWRADVDKNFEIELSVNQKPLKVIRKNLQDIKNDLAKLLILVSTEPRLEIDD